LDVPPPVGQVGYVEVAPGKGGGVSDKIVHGSRPTGRR
jgi:hypothetical protein